MSKIMVAVPTFENVSTSTFQSIYNMRRGDNNVKFEHIRGYDCAAARNNIVKKFLESDCDYLMMVDHDVVLPENALLDLLEDDKEVVSGYYAHRSASYDGKTCLCYLGHFNYDHQYMDEDILELKRLGTTVFQIKGGGMGCILIKRSLLERMKFPYFKWVEYDNGGTLSEDLYFCEQCKNMDVPIFADTRVSCGHIFTYIQWPFRT